MLIIFDSSIGTSEGSFDKIRSLAPSIRCRLLPRSSIARVSTIYSEVVLISECPRRSRMDSSVSPLANRSDATVLLMSWADLTGIPALRQILLIELSMFLIDLNLIHRWFSDNLFFDSVLKHLVRNHNYIAILLESQIVFADHFIEEIRALMRRNPAHRCSIDHCTLKICLVRVIISSYRSWA